MRPKAIIHSISVTEITDTEMTNVVITITETGDPTTDMVAVVADLRTGIVAILTETTNCITKMIVGSSDIVFPKSQLHTTSMLKLIGTMRPQKRSPLIGSMTYLMLKLELEPRIGGTMAPIDMLSKFNSSLVHTKTRWTYMNFYPGLIIEKLDENRL